MESKRMGLLTDGRWILPLFVVIELVQLSCSLTNMESGLSAVVAFPSIYVLPGMALLLVLRRGNNATNMTRLVVESFFVSTILSVAITSVMFVLRLPLTQITYSVIALLFVSFLAMIASVRKIEFRPTRFDMLLVSLAFLFYVLLFCYFSRIPRLFTPDETSYISSARMGVLDGLAPPMGVMPSRDTIAALFEGRCFWIYLLTSFMGSTGIPAYQGGLLSVSFIIMSALASSLFVNGKWPRLIVFAMVVLNPLLFLFSALTLNDLAIAFYAVFASLFFVEAFSTAKGEISINKVKLAFSFLSLGILLLNKPNLLLFVSIWITLVYVMLRYRLWKKSRKYKVLLAAVISPVLLYELCVDLPYCISVWMMRSREGAYFFGRFLFISPIESLLSMFVTPWWNSATPPLFARSTVEYFDYLYRLLMPESTGILVAAVVLALPILILLNRKRLKLNEKVLALLTFLSLWLFLFVALGSQSLSDVSRLSLWMLPLWIPLTIMTVTRAFRRPSLAEIFTIIIAAFALLCLNIWLSGQKGGVFIGHDLPYRLLTIDSIVFQFVSVSAALVLLLSRKTLQKIVTQFRSKSAFLRKISLGEVSVSILIVMTLLNGIHFRIQFVEQSSLYKDHSLTTMSDNVNKFASSNSMVFANNYIQMRPYVNETLFKEGLIMPLPDSETDFASLIDETPNNTLLLISDDSATTWYEYANTYLGNYTYLDAIVPEEQSHDLSGLCLPDRLLYMTFDDAEGTEVLDHSGSGNDGVNHGAYAADGYKGRALEFRGSEYVSIPHSSALDIQREITVSFYAVLQDDSPLRGYMIVSKGYAPDNGSYDVFVWDGKLYFSLGGVGSVSIKANSFLGVWHHFLFAYDGEYMSIYVDGIPTASKPASGSIRSSDYDVEIGRDSERKDYPYVGLLDELQISSEAVNATYIVEAYSGAYALSICREKVTGTSFNLYKTVNPETKRKSNPSWMELENARITIDERLAIVMTLGITSVVSRNVTLFIGTDRFSKIYPLPMNSGQNVVEFRFDYVIDTESSQAGGYYWLHLAQVRIVAVDEEGSILFSRFISKQNLQTMNALLLILLAVALSILLIGVAKEPQNQDHAPTNSVLTDGLLSSKDQRP